MFKVTFLSSIFSHFTSIFTILEQHCNDSRNSGLTKTCACRTAMSIRENKSKWIQPLVFEIFGYNKVNFWKLSQNSSYFIFMILGESQARSGQINAQKKKCYLDRAELLEGGPPVVTPVHRRIIPERAIHNLCFSRCLLPRRPSYCCLTVTYEHGATWVYHAALSSDACVNSRKLELAMQSCAYNPEWINLITRACAHNHSLLIHKINAVLQILFWMIRLQSKVTLTFRLWLNCRSYLCTASAG